MKILLILLLILSSFSCSPAPLPENFVLPSGKEEEVPEEPSEPSRPTLPTFEKTFSASYAVAVQRSNGTWENIDVHDCLCSDASKHSQMWRDWGNSKALRDTMAFSVLQNDFSGPVKIRVRRLQESFRDCQIRPSTYSIPLTKIDSRTVEFSLPSFDKRKVSLEFDGDRFHNLVIFANKPYEKAPLGSIYYGPGVHNAGKIYLSEGQTLFLDYGAYVYGQVIAAGNNITIAGNGVLSGEKMPHQGDNLYSWGDFLINCNAAPSYVQNLRFENFTMIDGPGWNLIVGKADGVTIDGVNAISWELNGDGIDIVCCKNVEISNCFLRNYDDCITLKARFIVNPMTDVSDIKIHDNLIWADYARGLVVGPEAGSGNVGHIHDVEIADCIFLEQGNGADDVRAAFAIGQGSKGNTSLWSGTDPPAKMYGIYAHDLVFDNICSNGRVAAIWQYADPSVFMDDVTLENFRILDGKKSKYPPLYIKTNGAKITGLRVSSITVDGSPVSGLSIDHPENVTLIN